MTTHHPTPHNEAHHKQQFYLGFLAGAVIGAGIAYLSVQKHGGAIKKDLLKKAKDLAKELPDVLDYLDSEEESPIEKGLHVVEELVTSDPDKVVEPSSTEKAEAAISQTASQAKRFFTKAGKLLRKKIG